MTIHNAELIKQQQNYRDVRARLMGKPSPRTAPPKLTVINGRKPVDMSYHVTLYRNYMAMLRERFVMASSFTVTASPEYCPYRSEIVFEIDSLPAPKKSMKQIAMEVLEDYPGITLEIIKGNRRDRAAVSARHMIVYQIKTQQSWRSFPEVGGFVNKDHSSAIHSFNKLKAELEGDEISIAKNERKKQRKAAHWAGSAA